MESEFDFTKYKSIVRDVKRTYKQLAVKFDYFYPPLKPRNKFIGNLHDFLQSHGVKKLLDCSCGTGRELIPLALKGAYDLVVGSDLSPEMIEQAKQKSVELPIKWIESDWIELPYKIGYRDFDAIICLGNSMAHVPPWSYKAIFSNISKMIKRGGVFLLNRRNIEAELGISKFKNNIPLTLLFTSFNGKSSEKELPRISLLNHCYNNGKEILAYFTYHSYGSEFRFQLLHLIECDSIGNYSQQIFKFKTYYEKESPVKKALLCSGFNDVRKLNFIKGQAEFDRYAEEVFYCSRKK